MKLTNETIDILKTFAKQNKISQSKLMNIAERFLNLFLISEKKNIQINKSFRLCLKLLAMIPLVTTTLKSLQTFQNMQLLIGSIS